ncbi:hypothetical protein TELCIR_17088, partial [Teladorsagia circumcincta]
VSLFREIPTNRSCIDNNVVHNFCLCMEPEPKKSRSKIDRSTMLRSLKRYLRRHRCVKRSSVQCHEEGAKTREIGEGVKLYYNGEETKRNGVAIAVAESLKDHVSAVNRISDRIMAVRIDTKEGYWTVISVYAPQAGYPEDEKDEFYLRLDVAIRSIPDGDYLTIADCPDPVEGTRTTSAIVWARSKEATRPSDKNNDGLRSAR